jgi:pimeloyl-ACP methyl ester carboxylesterase
MLTRIKPPTLLMFRRDDRVTPLDRAPVAMRLIRKCELHVFYDCGHCWTRAPYAVPDAASSSTGRCSG